MLAGLLTTYGTKTTSQFGDPYSKAADLVLTEITLKTGEFIVEALAGASDKCAFLRPHPHICGTFAPAIGQHRSPGVGDVAYGRHTHAWRAAYCLQALPKLTSSHGCAFS